MIQIIYPYGSVWLETLVTTKPGQGQDRTGTQAGLSEAPTPTPTPTPPWFGQMTSPATRHVKALRNLPGQKTYRIANGRSYRLPFSISGS